MILNDNKEVVTPPDFDQDKVDSWKDDDDNLVESFKNAKSILDIKEMDFFVKGRDSKATFHELVSQNATDTPDLDYREALVTAFAKLPERLNDMLLLLTKELTKIIGNRKEIYTYVARVYKFNQLLMKRYLEQQEHIKALEIKFAGMGAIKEEKKKTENKKEPLKEEKKINLLEE